ncbi:HNH endonuclease [Paenibacillus lactis]|uniref:HNH endonuclease n=1 Tax=Paenibacillus lactis TaxID=228574 RepID=UPI0036AA6442
MELVKKAGAMAGKLAGRVIGGSVRVAGELAGSSYVKEIGDSIESTTARTGQIVGDLTSGIVDIGVGALKQDKVSFNSGFMDAKGAVTQTISGLGQGISTVIESGVDIGSGIMDGEGERVGQGLKQLGKVAAVGTLAIGLFDVAVGLDGSAEASPSGLDAGPTGDDQAEVFHQMEAAEGSEARSISTINDSLEGELHPVTDVPYDSKVVATPEGDIMEGVFPDFEEAYHGYLPESIYLETDAAHFTYMNHQLSSAVMDNPELASSFTEEQLAQIRAGETPDGYVWHHTEEPGRMELVDEQTHATSAHTGGRYIWGGGSDSR